MTAAATSTDFLKSPIRHFLALWVLVLFSLIAEPLTGIRWITGGWIAIRAAFDLLRIWPVIGSSPLKP